MSEYRDYTGQIIDLHYSLQGKEDQKTGIVYRQKDLDDFVKFHIFLTNGQEWTPVLKKSEFTASPAQLDNNLTTALSCYCEVKGEQIEFLERFWKEKIFHEERVEAALQAVKEKGDGLTFVEFSREIEKIFTEKYPAGGIFSLNSLSVDEITVDQIQKVAKYATPEQYPFLHREYDGSIFINESAPGYLEFCKRNAPPIVPELRNQYTSYLSAWIGDKGTLSVHRTYEIPLKYGITKQSLQHLKEQLPGALRLEDQIKKAAAHSDSPGKTQKQPEPER